MLIPKLIGLTVRAAKKTTVVVAHNISETAKKSREEWNRPCSKSSTTKEKKPLLQRIHDWTDKQLQETNTK